MNLINLYKKILRIRKIETKISEEYSKGKMRCPVHLSIGQEAPAVGEDTAGTVSAGAVPAHHRATTPCSLRKGLPRISIRQKSH